MSGRAKASRGPAQIETRRLRLRLPEARDAGPIALLADNPKVALQTARMPYPYSRQDARAWIARARAARNETTFVIVGRGDGRVLGATGYGRLAGDAAEVGYWLGEPYWGRGLATEALAPVIEHAFTVGEEARLRGRCRTGNAASRRVLEKCGFVHEGTDVAEARALNGPVAVDVFSLDRAIWREARRLGRG